MTTCRGRYCSNAEQQLSPVLFFCFFFHSSNPDRTGFPHVVIHTWRKVRAESVCVHGHLHVHTVGGGESRIRDQFPPLYCGRSPRSLEQSGNKPSRCSGPVRGNGYHCAPPANPPMANYHSVYLIHNSTCECVGKVHPAPSLFLLFCLQVIRRCTELFLQTRPSGML